MWKFLFKIVFTQCLNQIDFFYLTLHVGLLGNPKNVHFYYHVSKWQFQDSIPTIDDGIQYGKEWSTKDDWEKRLRSLMWLSVQDYEIHEEIELVNLNQNAIHYFPRNFHWSIGQLQGHSSRFKLT